MASIVERLTENIVERNLLREGAALSKKWERTGLLEGIDSDVTRTTMSRLLENQAKELLREASTMSAGDVEGFAAVAFPIVRRVFGGLIANELVAVQPMSLPSGLIFFLDFAYSTGGAFDGTAAGAPGNAGNVPGNKTQSIYGGGVLASGITGGVDLTGVNVERSFYSLNNGYSSATGSLTGAYQASFAAPTGKVVVATAADFNTSYASTSLNNLQLFTITGSDTLYSVVLGYDPDEASLNPSTYYSVLKFKVSDFVAANGPLNLNDLITINLHSASLAGTTSILSSSATVVRRLTRLSADKTAILVTVKGTTTASPLGAITDGFSVNATFAATDKINASAQAVGALTVDLFQEGAGNSSSFTSTSQTGQNVTIPEIDIKVDSIAVTATTKKLKAKWSPELGQDLNAYHNLDAEVELTSILSEHVALEIDQEILNDLVKGATAGTKYWSRRPGKFVNRDTGASITSVGAPPDFTGNVNMWYETLIETINDVSAQIHRKTRRGGANFLVTSPEVANILEFTSGFRADVSMEDLKGGSVGAVKAGSLSKKWDLYVDPYFPRNLVLVGRRGKAFLESGYVYAPYVPLMITPTIFGTEDFVPRKGLMTRYAKKMVRPDMFGLVVVQDLIG
jgi:hypothetical protein